MRLDVYLTKEKGVRSRSKAENLIKMGFVFVDGRTAAKAGLDVSAENDIQIISDYENSLGSYKLEKAFKDFNLDCGGAVCLDIGAANGGFTGVLLANGAKKVYAVDVGKCAFPPELTGDCRIKVFDNFNAREIESDTFGEKSDFAVIDVSFISLKLILPAVLKAVKRSGTVVALVKPQFEGKKSDLTKNGIVKSERQKQKILEGIKLFCTESGLTIKGVTPVPRLFENKNEEFLLYLQNDIIDN